MSFFLLFLIVFFDYLTVVDYIESMKRRGVTRKDIYKKFFRYLQKTESGWLTYNSYGLPHIVKDYKDIIDEFIDENDLNKSGDYSEDFLDGMITSYIQLARVSSSNQERFIDRFNRGDAGFFPKSSGNERIIGPTRFANTPFYSTVLGAMIIGSLNKYFTYSSDSFESALNPIQRAHTISVVDNRGPNLSFKEIAKHEKSIRDRKLSTTNSRLWHYKPNTIVKNGANVTRQKFVIAFEGIDSEYVYYNLINFAKKFNYKATMESFKDREELSKNFSKEDITRFKREGFRFAVSRKYMESERLRDGVLPGHSDYVLYTEGRRTYGCHIGYPGATLGNCINYRNCEYRTFTFKVNRYGLYKRISPGKYMYTELYKSILEALTAFSEGEYRLVNLP